MARWQPASPLRASAPSATAFRESLCGPSINHDAADGFAFRHQIEGIVDLLQRHHMSDEIVDVDLLVHVPIDDMRHVRAATRAAEGRADPAPPGDELEGARGNL